MKKIIVGIIAAVMLFGFTACAEGPDDSDVVDHNITKAAKNFEVQRRIAFVNGITDKIQLQIEGRCNVDPKDDRIFVTCKVAEGEGNDSYIRHQLYRSDNVFVIIEQGEPIKASAYHYRFTYKPQAIIPDPDFRGSMDETPLAEDNQQ
jgi:hypothetical protein